MAEADSNATIWIGVRSSVLSLALKPLAAERGLRAVGNAAGATYRIGDGFTDASDNMDVLVVDPTPAPSLVSLGALRAGATRSVLSTSELDRLPQVIDALELDLSLVSMSTLEAARHVQS